MKNWVLGLLILLVGTPALSNSQSVSASQVEWLGPSYDMMAKYKSARFASKRKYVEDFYNRADLKYP